MTVPWIIGSLHVLTLALGAGAIFARARALHRLSGPGGLPAVFRADNLWGVAAILWLATGLWRAFGGLEKGTAYYLSNPWFHAKLGLFVLIVVLEIWPAATLVRWRMAMRRGVTPDLSPARKLARVSDLELALVVVIVFLATAIGRGYGLGPS